MERAIQKLPIKAKFVVRSSSRGDRGLMVTARELRDLDLDELEAKLVEAKSELFNLRFQVVTGQLDNYRPYRASA